MKLYMRIYLENGILEIVLEQFGREMYFTKQRMTLMFDICLLTKKFVLMQVFCVQIIVLEMKIKILAHAKSYLIEYIALQMEAMDDEHVQNDLDAN